ncbi:MAG: cytochrome c oxidase subunit I [Gammaproteobacteria bacterium]|nr:cytochrome c oxidase subunit I [Gammaproteobacteria bacterium]
MSSSILVVHPNLTPAARNTLLLYLAISAVVFLLMMVFGMVMRYEHSMWTGLGAVYFYQIMTAHGVGMVGISGLAASAVMWFFLSRQVNLSTAILVTNLVLFLLGVVLILGSIFLGEFAAAWTFLYPLPAKSNGIWSNHAAAAYLVGLLLVGVGFLLLYLDVAWAIMKKYGNLGKALGWPQLFSNHEDEAPTTVIVASTMVAIINIAGIAGGAVVLVLSLVNLYMPAYEFDALLIKNLIFFFGHVFINATIYQAVIAVYEILPQYTQRSWKPTRVFLLAWTASTLMVLIVYPHHLFMDFAMPTWALILGQIISYMSGLPVLLVTAWGALTIVYRSGIKWDVTSSLLMLSMAGWACGVIPAIVDGTIILNNVLHNTQWVPGHFHTYLLLGLVPMLFGFMYYLVQSNGKKVGGLDTLAYWFYLLGGSGFVSMFLLGGKESIPRRWAVHLSEWVPYDRVAAVFATLVVVGALVFAGRFLTRITKVNIATS